MPTNTTKATEADLATVRAQLDAHRTLLPRSPFTAERCALIDGSPVWDFGKRGWARENNRRYRGGLFGPIGYMLNEPHQHDRVLINSIRSLVGVGRLPKDVGERVIEYVRERDRAANVARDIRSALGTLRENGYSVKAPRGGKAVA